MGAISVFADRVEVYSTSLAKIKSFRFTGDPLKKTGLEALGKPQQDLCHKFHKLFPGAKKIEMKPGTQGRVAVYGVGNPTQDQLDGIRSALAAYDLAASGVAKTAEPDESTLKQLADGLRDL